MLRTLMPATLGGTTMQMFMSFPLLEMDRSTMRPVQLANESIDSFVVGLGMLLF
jgi:hypothetical protein